LRWPVGAARSPAAFLPAWFALACRCCSFACCLLAWFALACRCCSFACCLPACLVCAGLSVALGAARSSAACLSGWFALACRCCSFACCLPVWLVCAGLSVLLLVRLACLPAFNLWVSPPRSLCGLAVPCVVIDVADPFQSNPFTSALKQNCCFQVRLISFPFSSFHSTCNNFIIILAFFRIKCSHGHPSNTSALCQSLSNLVSSSRFLNISKFATSSGT
jgi:hypothetical protein